MQVHLRGYRSVAGGGVLGLVDVAELPHAPQHVTPARDRLLRVSGGVEPRGRLRQPRDHGTPNGFDRQREEYAPVGDVGGLSRAGVVGRPSERAAG